MSHFSIGILSFVFILLFPVLYLVGFGLRYLVAWIRRKEGPKDRIWFYLIFASLIGFIVGSIAQPLWSKAVECRASGQPVLSCVFITTQ